MATSTAEIKKLLQPTTFAKHLITVLSLGLWALAIYYAYTQEIPRDEYAIALATIAFVIYIIREMSEEYEAKDHLELYLLTLSLISVIIMGYYLLSNFDELLTMRRGIASHFEQILSLLFMMAMLYLINREFGLSFLAVVIGSMFYAWKGSLFPGILSHSGLTPARIINVSVMNLSGFFGSITAIVAAWVALFLLYAGLLRGYGAFDYIMQIAFKAADYIRSGIAQSAVISSLIMGSINGAQTANAAMTGSITIPLMKKSGLKSSTAGGIEAVASSGGQIMPPVMGAGAFIMASILGITYAQVLLAGVIPGLVFYISVAVAVHYTAINQGLDTNLTIEQVEGVDSSESRLAFLLETIKFGIPFVILIITLGVLQWTIMSSALYTTVAMVITGVTFPLVGSAINKTDTTIREIVSKTVEGMRYGAVMFAPIVLIVAAINAIVDLLVTTGVPGILALALMDLSGGVLIFALLLAMLICIILGLGMPTVAAYTVVALLVAPTLIEQFGIPDLAAHFFVFYAAVLSGITPPIAIAVVVTTGIAGSNFWRTAIEALRISAPLFIMPFGFIYNQEVIVGGDPFYRLFSSILLLIGAVMVIHGLNYYKQTFDSRLLNWLLGIVFVVLGTITMVYPTDSVQVGAIILATSIFIGQMMTNENKSVVNIQEKLMK